LSGVGPTDADVSAFHLACHSGDAAAVRSALAAQPSLLRSVASESGFTPIVEALLGGQKALPALQVLREALAPADLNATLSCGRAPLHFAAAAHTRGSASLLWLVSLKVPVNVTDVDGLTPLHCAVQGLSVEAVEILIAAGADTKWKDSRGRTPRDVAIVACGTLSDAARKEFLGHLPE
jgi:hypothetical protein